MALDPNGQAVPDPSRAYQLFFSFYFAMTGVHALHMVIGHIRHIREGTCPPVLP
jgi:hypothetical protein